MASRRTERARWPILPTQAGTNTANSKATACHPGTLRSGMSEEAFRLRCTVIGVTYRKRLRRRITYPDCGVELAMGLMTAHRWRMHGMVPEVDWNQFSVSQAEHSMQVFDISFPKGTSQCLCPFPVCPSSLRTCSCLRNHFNPYPWGGGSLYLGGAPHPISQIR